MSKSDMKNEVMVDVRDVTKQFRVYGDKSHTFKDRILFHKRNKYEYNHVLNHVSFQVKRGQALGLIGHNGCGKSTTLKLLNKILYPDSGSIRMNGKISSLIELGAGFHPDMSGRENIYINATIFGLKRREIDKRLDDIIRFSELEQFIDNPVRTYSSGMYMRLAFSIAINVDADILLVDEILAVGDANFQKKCFDKLAEIKEQGATIVIVSHSMDQIKSVCDRVIWLDKGEIREDGEAKEVCERYLITMADIAREREREERRQEGFEVVEDPNVAFPVKDSCSQYGIYSRRSGNMKIRFEEIALCNKNEDKCTEFKYEDEAKVVFKLTAYSKDLVTHKVNIIFNIFHTDGMLCSTFVANLTDENRLNASECLKGTFCIDKLQLANGNYILDAILTDENGEAYDCLGHLIEFSVNTSSKLGTGIAAMPNKWNW